LPYASTQFHNDYVYRKDRPRHESIGEQRSKEHAAGKMHFKNINNLIK